MWIIIMILSMILFTYLIHEHSINKIKKHILKICSESCAYVDNSELSYHDNMLKQHIGKQIQDLKHDFDTKLNEQFSPGPELGGNPDINNMSDISSMFMAMNEMSIMRNMNDDDERPVDFFDDSHSTPKEYTPKEDKYVEPLL